MRGWIIRPRFYFALERIGCGGETIEKKFGRERFRDKDIGDEKFAGEKFRDADSEWEEAWGVGGALFCGAGGAVGAEVEPSVGRVDGV